jgi:thiazole synthase
MLPTNPTQEDSFFLGGRAFQSRLLMGTARYPNTELMIAALKAGAPEIVTVSIRRINLQQKEETFLDLLDPHLLLLPNTAGCFSAKEAILTAELAREALQTNWIKVEVIGDDYTLLPDSVELLRACEKLVASGFVVLPYCFDDPILCKRLESIGCAAVMPLAAPIGSGLGIRTPHNLELIRASVSIPIIVDAGIGTASDVALAMELGADAVLLNTAIAEAMNPVLMAEAMRKATEAGRAAYKAGRIPKSTYATPSSPVIGKIQVSDSV